MVFAVSRVAGAVPPRPLATPAQGAEEVAKVHSVDETQSLRTAKLFFSQLKALGGHNDVGIMPPASGAGKQASRLLRAVQVKQGKKGADGKRYVAEKDGVRNAIPFCSPRTLSDGLNESMNGACAEASSRHVPAPRRLAW